MVKMTELVNEAYSTVAIKEIEIPEWLQTKIEELSTREASTKTVSSFIERLRKFEVVKVTVAS